MLTSETIHNLLRVCAEYDVSLNITGSSGTLKIEFQIPKAEIQHLPLKGVLEFYAWANQDSKWEKAQRDLIEDLYIEKRMRSVIEKRNREV